MLAPFAIRSFGICDGAMGHSSRFAALTTSGYRGQRGRVSLCARCSTDFDYDIIRSPVTTTGNVRRSKGRVFCF